MSTRRKQLHRIPRAVTATPIYCVACIARKGETNIAVTIFRGDATCKDCLGEAFETAGDKQRTRALGLYGPDGNTPL